jgi:release factor glutamine methyltransferase
VAVAPEEGAPAGQAVLADRLRAAGCVFAEDEAALLIGAAPSTAALEVMVARRVAGLPLEQVLGWAEFCGLRVAVRPGVFVPRRRTELLVREAVALVRPGGVVLDLCCGSGAIGLAVATAVGGVELHAVDVDPVAVACARHNVASVAGHVHLGDLDRPLPPTLAGRVDVLVACPPYVPTEAIALMPPEARDHEPVTALDGGVDGLALAGRIAALAPRWLAPGGHLLLEAGERQAPRLAELLRAQGLDPSVVRDEERDATAVVGRKPARRL